MVLLPAPLGPIRPTISPAFTLKLTSLTATRPPNSLRAPLTVEQRLASRRHGPRGQRFGSGGTRRWRALGHERSEARPQPLARGLQQEHQQRAEHDHLVVASAAEQLGQDALELVLQQRDEARAEDGAADVARAAEHGHQQVLDALR